MLFGEFFGVHFICSRNLIFTAFNKCVTSSNYFYLLSIFVYYLLDKPNYFNFYTDVLRIWTEIVYLGSYSKFFGLGKIAPDSKLM